MRRFSLFRRGDIFYCQLRNPQTGRRTAARSTGATDRDGALLVVAAWLKDGIPTGRRRELRPAAEAFTLEAVLSYVRERATAEDAERILAALKDRGLGATVKDSEAFTAFLTRFWTYGESPYVREKLAHGQRIGRRHCYDRLLDVKNRWTPAFLGRRLGEITRQDIRDFGIRLHDSGLAPKSVNRILEVGTVALRWAHANELIPTNPASGVRKFSGPGRRRGVLTPEEAAKVFKAPWPDERGRVGNLVAMTTGLRAGEILALRVQDIGEDRLYVRHSWSQEDKLHDTKTHQERTVPLLPAVRGELLRLVASSPWGAGPDAFVFYGGLPDRPIDFHYLRDGLAAALESIGIAEDERRRRWLTVHSWRHYYAARMADRIDARKVQLATGHKTPAMLAHYADHALESDLAEVQAAMADVFSNVVPFAREAAGQ